MDIEEIKQFVKAGYTKEEIEKLEASASSQQGSGESSETATDDKSTAKDENSAGAEKAGAVAPDVMVTLKSLTDTVNGLNETVKAMQALNVKGAQTPETGKKGVDEVMKSFIEKL